MRAFLSALLIILVAPVSAEEVAVFAGDLRLAGSFEDGSEAAALILAGSGPTDRDGNSAQGLNSDTYALLARGLAEAGIASIRADKRGVGGSRGDGNAVTLEDYASDAGLWVSALKQRTGQDCVWLIGHSEGGLIALQTAQERPDLCGLVLLATPGRGFDEILLEQLAAAPAMVPLLDDMRAFLARLEAGETVTLEEMPVPLVPLFPPAVHDYMRNLLAFDPVEAAAAIDLPVLVIQGARDLQTGVADAEALVAALRNARLMRFAAMTHMLKDADGTQEAKIATYTNPALPLTVGLVAAIAGFVAP